MKLEQLIDTSLLPKGTEQNGVCIPYGTIPLWFLNDDLKEDEIERQIEDFHQKGISGVMLHPRCYIPKTLEYMSERYLELFEFATEGRIPFLVFLDVWHCYALMAAACVINAGCVLWMRHLSIRR